MLSAAVKSSCSLMSVDLKPRAVRIVTVSAAVSCSGMPTGLMMPADEDSAALQGHKWPHQGYDNGDLSQLPRLRICLLFTIMYT